MIVTINVLKIKSVQCLKAVLLRRVYNTTFGLCESTYVSVNFKPYLTCPSDINLKEPLWFFDKICSQMLNNFSAFSTVFYNFYVALTF